MPQKNEQGRGRPPLPKGEKLSERVTVNMTPSERKALRKLAGEESEGSFLRRLFARFLARRRK